jgi:hypothetical protein
VNESTRKIVLGTGAGIALLIAAVLFVRSLSGGSRLPRTTSIDGVCLNCHESGEFTYPVSQSEPLTCPKCGERAVYSWFFCHNCNRRFVPNLETHPDRPPSVPVVPVCPACGSSRTGSYIKEDPTQQPVGDAPLPKWPPE